MNEAENNIRVVLILYNQICLNYGTKELAELS